jgi:hypothetical protein
VLRDRIPGAGKKPLRKLIEQGADAGILTARQAEYLDYGRKIRNGMAHGRTTHAVMPPAMAVPMVTTSFAIFTELCTAVPCQRTCTGCHRSLTGGAVAKASGHGLRNRSPGSCVKP